jgi:hypothetical protein
LRNGAEPGERGRANNAKKLPDDFARASIPNAPANHAAMNADMVRGYTLTEDVRTLEVMETARCIARRVSV